MTLTPCPGTTSFSYRPISNNSFTLSGSFLHLRVSSLTRRRNSPWFLIKTLIYETPLAK
ncbi:hypothetical protein F2Q68_00022721 [Brassica cretica]|uniref:Uncharacterized protein n=1 Tax=Brassica cretica TaxID=69181 RepID=A0A8S9FX20_BRACR|nr:hypothetical protein F2Q68_00022721 [Brassica cretica]